MNGTMNDLAVSGAKGRAMVVTFILEEGLPTSVLEAKSARWLPLFEEQASPLSAEIPK